MPRREGGWGTRVLGAAGEKGIWFRCWRASESQKGQGTFPRSHNKLVAEPGTGLRALDSLDNVPALLPQSGLKQGSHNPGRAPLCLIKA